MSKRCKILENVSSNAQPENLTKFVVKEQGLAAREDLASKAALNKSNKCKFCHCAYSIYRCYSFRKNVHRLKHAFFCCRMKRRVGNFQKCIVNNFNRPDDMRCRSHSSDNELDNEQLPKTMHVMHIKIRLSNLDLQISRTRSLV